MTATPVKGLADLKARVAAGGHDFGIMLAGGMAYSRKTIKTAKGRWVVKNHIDDTRQTLTDGELWTESNIGEALDKGALVEFVG